MVNDCYYMLKEFPLLGLLFGNMPGLSMVTMANVLIAVPVTENYLPTPLWIEGKCPKLLRALDSRPNSPFYCERRKTHVKFIKASLFMNLLNAPDSGRR